MTQEIFKKKNVWLFDLDNTVYSPETKIFDQIDKRMKTFISKKLKISQESAFKIQKLYYKKYGTTLFGLMKNYNFEPNEFLEFVHNVDLDNLKKSSKLFKLIELLPGKKIIYTNGDHKYAERVLTALGIENLFDEIFDIKKSRYIPKPKIKPFREFLECKKIKTQDCVYFEDLEENLKSAYKIGITTIHIHNEKKPKIKPFIDFRFKTIINALDMINNSINN
ncbi:MAG: pyrimidine 5'-nucleotidase [Rickettsiales bacterium]|nr:pyrimidine 5'-nucleotidase [Rickettsiales bacterium]|tara:strand:+ start:577 stop:1242 length:666 start_codon:yes stop_codon:yes gene_type:complete